MKQLLKIKNLKPTVIFAWLLVANLVLYIGYDFSWSFLQTVLLAALTLSLGFWSMIALLHWFTDHSLIKTGKLFSTNSIITVLLLISVADNSASAVNLLLLGIITAAIKVLVRWKNQPLVNPAAAGILVTALFYYFVPIRDLATLPFWAAAGYGQQVVQAWTGLPLAINLPLNIGIAWYVSRSFRKGKIIVSSLLAATLMQILLSQDLNAGIFTLEGSFLFFAATMIAEPKTSPVLKNQQYVFGVAIGVLASVLTTVHFVAPYLGSLVLGNLGFKLWQFLELRTRR